MGKNKWYTELEGGPDQGYRPSGAPKTKRSSSLPGLFVNRQHDDVDMSLFMKVIRKHFQRHWHALRFLLNRISLGAFQRKTLLKLGFLVGAAYYLIDTGKQSAAGIGGFGSSSIDWNQETNLAVAEEKPRAVPAAKKEKKAPKNDSAPTQVEQIKGDRAQVFIQKYASVAREEMAKFGIPASIGLAQGLIESRAGTSTLAVQNNNLFGMKCFSRNCRKGHCTNHTDDSHKDFFLKFTNPSQSWRAHSQLLSRGRYQKLKKYGRDFRRWAYGLEQIGYATDRSYAENLIRTIERYDLSRFDR